MAGAGFALSTPGDRTTEGKSIIEAILANGGTEDDARRALEKAGFAAETANPHAALLDSVFGQLDDDDLDSLIQEHVGRSIQGPPKPRGLKDEQQIAREDRSGSMTPPVDLTSLPPPRSEAPVATPRGLPRPIAAAPKVTGPLPVLTPPPGLPRVPPIPGITRPPGGESTADRNARMRRYTEIISRSQRSDLPRGVILQIKAIHGAPTPAIEKARLISELLQRSSRR